MRTRSSGKVHEVDRILGRKLDNNNEYLYQVRWKGHGAGESWCSLEELPNAELAIGEYEKSLEGVVAEEAEGQEKERRDENIVSNIKDEHEEAIMKKIGKVAHFADNVEKKEQRIVGGKWQTVFEDLKG